MNKPEGIENKFLIEDSISGLGAVPDESVHLILSDIPYGIGAEDWDVLHENTNSAYLGKSPAPGKGRRGIQKTRQTH